MKGFKLTIIGAGSTYTPELIEGLSQWRDKLQASEVALYDIDEKRLRIMHAFCQRYAHKLGINVNITMTTDRARAIDGADFVNTQIRVGGNAARVKDELIPLSFGLIGQETTGAGGFAKALRTIPKMLEIARDVERYAPDAWIVNYTNPTGLVAEAINGYSKAKIAGFCSGGIFPKMWASKAMGIHHDRVRYDYVGLNHMNFITNVMIDGKPITQEQLMMLAAQDSSVDIELLRLTGCLMSPYLQYYYHGRQRVEKLKAAPMTRGQQVMALEEEIYAAYANLDVNEKPEALARRGGGGYSEVAMGFLDAVHNDRDTWMIVNVPNQGAVSFLPDNSCVEIGCLVNKAGAQPLKVRNVPVFAWGLIAEVKNYEQLAVEAAVEGDRDKARLALLTHPLVREYALVEPLLTAILEAHKDDLPQFFGMQRTVGLKK